jgi:type IV pilus assembly protein PilQ
MPNHNILLTLNVNQDKVSPLTVNGVPAIQTQKISTQVLVKNQHTFVLGGIYEQDHSIQDEGVPGLRRIPLLGALFQHHHRVNRQSQLLIFVTPMVMH